MALKLGKKPARIDKRTIKFQNIKKILPPIPTIYEFIIQGISFPNRMWMNNIYGNCVIAAQANQRIRFEAIEQNTLINISDSDVKKEYFRQSENVDSGLVMLNSLNEERNTGWRIGGRKILCFNIEGSVYKDNAFASINWFDHNEVRAAIYLLTGIRIGMSLPNNFEEAFEAGKPWTDTSMPPNPNYGHALYFMDYPDEKYFRCLTWGKEVLVGMDFFDKYVDEAYAIVDAIDPWAVANIIDVVKLREYLKEVQK